MKNNSDQFFPALFDFLKFFFRYLSKHRVQARLWFVSMMLSMPILFVAITIISLTLVSEDILTIINHFK